MAVTENITVLFTDLVGSTELASSLTPETLLLLVRRHEQPDGIEVLLQSHRSLVGEDVD